jgi:membrane associated rhomboid family serine protease
MLPLKDDVKARSTPFVTVGLIVLNAVTFVYQLSLAGTSVPGSGAAQAFIFEFGLIPCRLTGYCEGVVHLPSPALTVVTSMFLHGGLFHIAGNMLYLWIFGNNVEDTLGHGRFVAFYLLSGITAAVAQTAVNPDSRTPMIGASGAVSGVLGAYLLLFPHANVLTLLVFGFFVRLVRIPAVIVLGFWIVVQLLNGFVTFREASGTDTGGVAWFAHIGGFAGGILFLFLLRPRPRARSW